MTKEQIIKLSEQIRDHLIAQNKQSISAETGNCMYRGENGAMCAVGCLIKDEFYSRSIEDRISDEPEVVEALSKSLGIELTIEEHQHVFEMLYEWQTYHDCDYRRFVEGASETVASPRSMHIELVNRYTKSL